MVHITLQLQFDSVHLLKSCRANYNKCTNW